MEKTNQPKKPNQQKNLLKQKLLRYLASRPRSISECQKHLAKNQASENLQIEIIDEFVEQKLLDDLEFSTWLVASRLRSKPKGKIALRFELKKFGIADQIINQVLADIEAETLVEAATKQLDRAAYRYQKFSGFELKSKLYSMLARKGFSSSVSKIAIDAWLAKQ